MVAFTIDCVHFKLWKYNFNYTLSIEALWSTEKKVWTIEKTVLIIDNKIEKRVMLNKNVWLNAVFFMVIWTIIDKVLLNIEGLSKRDYWSHS